MPGDWIPQVKGSDSAQGDLRFGNNITVSQVKKYQVIMQVNWVETQAGEVRQVLDTKTKAWGLKMKADTQLSVLGRRTEPDQCQTPLDVESQKAGLQGPLTPAWDQDETSSPGRAERMGARA